MTSTIHFDLRLFTRSGGKKHVPFLLHMLNNDADFHSEFQSYKGSEMEGEISFLVRIIIYPWERNIMELKRNIVRKLFNRYQIVTVSHRSDLDEWEDGNAEEVEKLAYDLGELSL